MTGRGGGRCRTHLIRGSVFGTPFGALRRSSPPGRRGCETERMTIEKFHWPLGLGPDDGKAPSPTKAKEFFVRSSEASAPRDEGSSENAAIAPRRSSTSRLSLKRSALVFYQPHGKNRSMRRILLIALLSVLSLPALAQAKPLKGFNTGPYLALEAGIQ